MVKPWKIDFRDNTEKIMKKTMKLLSGEKKPVKISELERFINATSSPDKYAKEDIIIAVKILSEEGKIDISFERVNRVNIFYIKIKDPATTVNEPAKIKLPNKPFRKNLNPLMAVHTAMRDSAKKEMRISDLWEKANEYCENPINKEVFKNILERLKSNEMIKVFTPQIWEDGNIEINRVKIKTL